MTNTDESSRQRHKVQWINIPASLALGSALLIAYVSRYDNHLFEGVIPTFHRKIHNSLDTELDPSSKPVLFRRSDFNRLRHESQTIVLSIAGQVFDVTVGAEFYGATGGYGHFSYTDGTRAFVTGQFDEANVIDDISDFTPSQCIGLNSWLEFYSKSTKYPKLGLFAGGYFYDLNGNPTAGMESFLSCLETGKNEEEARRLKAVGIDCNINIDFVNKRRRLWCTAANNVPRIVKYQQEGNELVDKCVCIDTEVIDVRSDLITYDSCPSHSFECFETIQ